MAETDGREVNKGGRPFRYTVDKLNAKIDDYFDSHNTKDNIPKWPDMLNFIGLSDETMRLYRTDEKYIEAGYLDCVKRAERMFSSTLIQLAVDNPNLQSLVIFLLKQPHNGGYQDRQVSESSVKNTVELKIGGLDVK